MEHQYFLYEGLVYRADFATSPLLVVKCRESFKGARVEVSSDKDLIGVRKMTENDRV